MLLYMGSLCSSVPLLIPLSGVSTLLKCELLLLLILSSMLRLLLPRLVLISMSPYLCLASLWVSSVVNASVLILVMVDLIIMMPSGVGLGRVLMGPTCADDDLNGEFTKLFVMVGLVYCVDACVLMVPRGAQNCRGEIALC